jgi:hypothetical protein
MIEKTRKPLISRVQEAGAYALGIALDVPEGRYVLVLTAGSEMATALLVVEKQ